MLEDFRSFFCSFEVQNGLRVIFLARESQNFPSTLHATFLKLCFMEKEATTSQGESQNKGKFSLREKISLWGLIGHFPFRRKILPQRCIGFVGALYLRAQGAQVFAVITVLCCLVCVQSVCVCVCVCVRHDSLSV